MVSKYFFQDCNIVRKSLSKQSYSHLHWDFFLLFFVWSKVLLFFSGNQQVPKLMPALSGVLASCNIVDNISFRCCSGPLVNKF